MGVIDCGVWWIFLWWPCGAWWRALAVGFVVGSFFSLCRFVGRVFVSRIHTVQAGRDGFLDCRNFVLSALLAPSHESSRGRGRLLAGCHVGCTDHWPDSLRYSG